MATSVPILAFNDVYRVQQRYVPQPGCPDPPNAFPPGADIKVGQFAQLVYDLRAQWPPRKPGLAEGGSDDDGRDGLFLFAGDVFSPSVESSVTRGSHMVSICIPRASKLVGLACPHTVHVPHPSHDVVCFHISGSGRIPLCVSRGGGDV